MEGALLQTHLGSLITAYFEYPCGLLIHYVVFLFVREVFLVASMRLKREHCSAFPHFGCLLLGDFHSLQQKIFHQSLRCFCHFYPFLFCLRFGAISLLVYAERSRKHSLPAVVEDRHRFARTRRWTAAARLFPASQPRYVDFLKSSSPATTMWQRCVGCDQLRRLSSATTLWQRCPLPPCGSAAAASTGVRRPLLSRCRRRPTAVVLRPG